MDTTYLAKPNVRPITQHDGAVYFDCLHRAAMERGSDELRDRIFRLLADRAAQSQNSEGAA